MQLTLWETATGRKAQTLKVQAAPLAMGELRVVSLAFTDGWQMACAQRQRGFEGLGDGDRARVK